MKKNSFNPDWCSKPANTIIDCLEALNLSKEDFTIKMNMSIEEIDKLLKAEIEITPSIAKKLEDVIGVSTQFWLNRERDYREGLAKGLKDIDDIYGE